MKIEYLCFILYLQISFKKCTIDINIPEYIYIADHLTEEECRRLFAALHYISYELPEDLSEAVKHIPEEVPCIKLLMQWNSGDEKYEGKRKTHFTMEHRLRQIGKSDIADWLGKTVFHNIGKELNNTHADPTYFEDQPPKSQGNNPFKDKDSRNFGEGWTTIDTILCVLLFGLLIVTMSAFLRMLRVSLTRSSSKDKDEEEMIDLLSAGSMDSDQETPYDSEDKDIQHNIDVARSTSTNQLR